VARAYLTGAHDIDKPEEVNRYAAAAAEHSIDICDQERWNAFVPWPQALRAHCLAATGRRSEARDDAESAFALACQLGDPCWEGMAGRALALLALHAGDAGAAGKWITDARRRCDRLPDRYVWVSGFVALGHLEIAATQQHELVMPLARRLYQDGLRADLPEFIAWALIYQAEAGDLTNLPLARTLAAGIVNPALQARVTALEDLHTSVGGYPLDGLPQGRRGKRVTSGVLHADDRASVALGYEKDHHDFMGQDEG
jgi:hypothetical protein